jgi:hypothetical protein
MLGFVDAVTRVSDGELCGYVEQREGVWVALTVFGASIGEHQERAGAFRQVLDTGLDSLSRHWTLRNGASGEEEVVCIAQASPGVVVVARDYYSLPGVPKLTITREQLEAGEWELLL